MQEISTFKPIYIGTRLPDRVFPFCTLAVLTIVNGKLLLCQKNHNLILCCTVHTGKRTGISMWENLVPKSNPSDAQSLLETPIYRIEAANAGGPVTAIKEQIGVITTVNQSSGIMTITLLESFHPEEEKVSPIVSAEEMEKMTHENKVRMERPDGTWIEGNLIGCDFCHVIAGPKLRCSRCQVVYYCSKVKSLIIKISILCVCV